MSGQMIKRAIGNKQKELKRRIILDSALRLFEESEGALATVESIAKRANIAKGTIYLYFKTREEIYMALLEDFINQWISLIETMGEIKDQSIKGILAVICRFIEEKPAFMKLASIFNGILEKNIDFETAYACKLSLRERVLSASRTLSGLYPGITQEKAAKMILRSFALGIGLWQIAEPTPILKQVLAKEELRVLRIDFMSELKDTLQIIWEGSLKE